MSWLLERLQRVTTSGRYLPEVDGLRFVAIFYVFAQHARQAIVHNASDAAQSPTVLFMFEDASLGVELFFLLSGFILALPFVGQHVHGEPPVSLRAYFLRRLTRLEPPYVLALVLALFYRLYHPLRPIPPAEAAEHFLASLFYVHNQTHGLWHPSSINTVTWSLEVEVQFYLLAPVLAHVFRLPPLARRLGLALGSVAVASVAARGGPALAGTVLYFLPYFAAGMVLADLRDASWRERAHLGWDVVTLAASVAAFLVASYSRADETVLVAICLFLAVLGAMRGRAFHAALSFAPVRTIGGMCYSIYLLHWILLWILWRALDVHPSATSVGGSFGVTALLFVAVLPPCVVYYVLVERPCMQKDWWRIGRIAPT